MLKRWIAVSAAAMLLVSGCSKEKAEEPEKQDTEKAEEATKGSALIKNFHFNIRSQASDRKPRWMEGLWR